ncbi:MAG TPA: hypothetical protein VNH18_18845 [Bryobacteraceae bacterium]|nr:hypothetical protein [Bryobacteraceae bacterium]
MLRKRYEQMRERVLEQSATGAGSDLVMRRGMRSWMEVGWQEETAVIAPAPADGRLRPKQNFQQMVAVWASVLLWQAERS